MDNPTIIRCQRPKCNRRIFDINNLCVDGKVEIQVACPKCGEVWNISVTADSIKIFHVLNVRKPNGRSQIEKATDYKYHR